MEEIRPGLFHWTAMHPHIHTRVSSYWLDGTGVAIDPLLSDEVGLEWFEAFRHKPCAVLLSNRHHYRSAGELAKRFNCPILCNNSGMHEFTHGERVEGFHVGAHLPGPAVACEMGAICDDDTVLYLPGYHALVFADGVVRGQAGVLGFVPHALMDDHEVTEAGLLSSCQRLLDDESISFKHLLLAHGGPVLDNGRELLQELVDAGGRTSFEF